MTKNDVEQERFQRIFEQTIVGIAQCTADGKVVIVNDRFCQILRRSRDELIGMSMQELTHPDDLPKNLNQFQSMFNTGNSFEIEKRYLLPDGTYVWVRNHVSVVRDENGKPKYGVAVTMDISDQRLQLEVREREARRNKFLSEVSMALNSSLDLKETLHKITQLAVPDFGDWCYIHLANAEGSIDLSEFSAHDPALLPVLAEFAPMVPTMGPKNAVSTVMATGKSVMRGGLNDDYYKIVAQNTRQLELFRRIAPKSVIVAPLRSMGKLLGTLTVSTAKEKDYSEADLLLIEEVAVRAALAIDNARLYTETRKAVRMRDEFVSLASHELKTPLTSLKLLNQFTQRKIQKGELVFNSEENLKKLFNEYDGHITRISRLVDDMLDMTRLQLGSYRLSLDPADLNKCIVQTCEELYPQVRNAGCTFDISLRGDLTATFDVMRIQQVISNIVTNAFKYAPGSAIHITANGSGESINLTISDEGPGIEKENLHRIFERFERAIPSSSISGLGLGLYISRRIIEAHGGKIWAESTLGEGTKLFIELPRKGPQANSLPFIVQG